MNTDTTPPSTAGDRFAAASRPSGADRYATWWKVWLPIPILLILLDVTFNTWFWHIPKLTGRDADYSYQYLYDLEHLHGTKRDGVFRIVGFGSSVSSAFDPFQVQSLLDAKNLPEPVEVRRLTKPGSKPSDHELVWSAERDAIKPDVVVMVFNLVDFLNPSFERDLKPDIRYILPPWRTLMDRWRYVPTVAEKLQLAVASVSNIYRYRRPLQSAIEDNIRALGRWVTAGRSTGGGYGWHPDGFTDQRFGIPLSVLAGQPFEYFVHPAWIAQRGSVRLDFAVDGVPLTTRTETTPGWKTLPLDGVSGTVLQVTADSAWVPRASDISDDVRPLGVQLRSVPPSNVNHGRPPFRYALKLPSDPDDFLRMGGARGQEFADKWNATLEEDNDFAHRFRLYRDVKMATRDRTFRPDGEFAAVREMVGQFTAANIRVVLVNTPENALLDGVTTSPWYHDYLEFFRGLQRDNPLVRFVDLHDTLPPEDLNDWHHLNFIGVTKLGPVFAQVLADEIAESHGAAGGQGRAL